MLGGYFSRAYDISCFIWKKNTKNIIKKHTLTKKKAYSHKYIRGMTDISLLA